MSVSGTLTVAIAMDIYEFHIGSRRLAIAINQPIDCKNYIKAEGEACKQWLIDNRLNLISAIGDRKVQFLITQVAREVKFLRGIDVIADHQDLKINLAFFD